MKSLFEISQTYTIERPKTNPRGDLIKEFQKHLNREGFDIPWIGVSMKVRHIKDIDHLRVFYNDCLRSKARGSFSKCFFGALKVK